LRIQQIKFCLGIGVSIATLTGKSPGAITFRHQESLWLRTFSTESTGLYWGGGEFVPIAGSRPLFFRLGSRD